MRQALLLALAVAAAALSGAAWLASSPPSVRPLPGAEGILQRGAEGTCAAVAALAPGTTGRLDLRVEGPFVQDGCGGCASGAWPREACEVRLRPVSEAPGPFGGTLEVLRDGRVLSFVRLSGHASGLSHALHWRALPTEGGAPPLAFEMRNLGDAYGPPGAPVLLGPDAGEFRISWTDCGLPLAPGAACGVRLQVLRPGASALLAMPGVLGGIRVGGGDLSEW